MIFTETTHCTYRVHCTTCRSDIAWRRSLGQHYELPGGMVDFPCPLGLPIVGEVTDEKAVPITVTARTAQQPATPLSKEQVQRAEEQQRLSWAQAASRIAHGVIGLAKYHLGIGNSAADVQAARLAICDACELSQPKDQPVEARKCGKLLEALQGKGGCGCNLTPKTGSAGESCPIGKW